MKRVQIDDCTYSYIVRENFEDSNGHGDANERSQNVSEKFHCALHDYHYDHDDVPFHCDYDHVHSEKCDSLLYDYHYDHDDVPFHCDYDHDHSEKYDHVNVHAHYHNREHDYDR